MSPLGYIVIVLLLLLFGYPVLMDLREVIHKGLVQDLNGVPDSVKAVAILAMLLLTIVSLWRKRD